MTTLTVELSEVPLHLYQFLAGLHQLSRRGLRVRFRRLRPNDADVLPYNMLRIAADSGKRLIVDMNDGYANLLSDPQRVVPFYNGLLDKCDLLYKRSFDPAQNAKFSDPEKIRPTPPNFLVTVPGNPAHLPTPCDPRREQMKKLVRMLPISQYYNGHVREEKLFIPVRISSAPRILFMARLWDPAGDFPGQLTEQMAQERHEINESRSACIRLLRQEFGDRFFGGVAATPFAVRAYSDVVLQTPSLSRKDAYLEFMKSFDIQIATMGLHGSTGWKFAEYLAASKAIVSERLCYESAGGLCEGTHYLAFNNPDSCVQAVQKLKDNDLRRDMMAQNEAYARRCLRPEAFARSILRDAQIELPDDRKE